MSLDFTKSIFCVITGASRGIGQQIAVELARRAPKITLVLIARSALSKTQTLVETVNKDAVIFCHNLDLSSADATTFRAILSCQTAETSIIFHNAGQIGEVALTSNLDNRETWRKYYDLNVVSVAVLNACFLQLVRDSTTRVFVVNVTSLIGRQPFKYLSMYGSAKAARDMYFKVLALDEEKIQVLNYSPGMVETAMAEELVENVAGLPDSEISAAVKENPVKLTPEQTVLKLVSILEKGGYESGKIIDYYD